MAMMDSCAGQCVGTFFIGIVIIYLLYRLFAKKQSYWKEKGLREADPVPFFGSLLQNVKKPLHELELERYRTLGKIYGYYEGTSPLLSIADPKVLRNILVKDFHAFSGRRKIELGDPIFENMLQMLHGEDWKRVRTIVSPTFTTGKIKRMMGIFKECSSTIEKNFTAAAEKGEAIDVKRYYGAFTMDIIASAAFSTKIDSHNNPKNEFVNMARSVFSMNINWRFVFFLLFPRLMKLFQIKVFPPKGLKFFHNVTLEIMEERKRTGKTRNDFLQLLMDTAKEVEEDTSEPADKGNDILSNYTSDDKSDQMFKSTNSKKSLSLNELVAQCCIFFLAGYDTTASTLSFTSYMLALHEDIQKRLIDEIDEAVKAANGELTYEGVQNLKYLDNVISESMRLFPPAVRLERLADQDYRVEEAGFTISKDTIITIPTYAIHRDEAYFPDPEKFDPDRFNAEIKAKRDQYTFLPFGAGPRNCIGMRFALMEVKVCLAHILTKFRFKRGPETKVPLDYYIGNGLLQPKEVMLTFEMEIIDYINAFNALAIVIGTLIVAYFYKVFTKKPSYWKEKGIPEVEPAPFFGTVLKNTKKPLFEVDFERYKTLGSIHGYYEGTTPCLSVGNPKVLRNMLVKDFHIFPGRRGFSTGDPIFENMMQVLNGEDWKRVRTIVSPTFSTGKIKRMMSIFEECAQTIVKNFTTAAQKGESVDVKRLYGAFTMDVIASSAFSTKIDSHNDPKNEFVNMARSVFSKGINWRFVMYLLFPRLMKLFKVKVFPQKGLNFFRDVTLQLIEERKKSGKTRNDFLQLLLDASKEAEDNTSETIEKGNDILSNYETENMNGDLFKNSYSKKSLSPIEVVAQCCIFFLAGYDTTASALSFASYMLALNEDVQEKLIGELEDTIKAHNGELTYEAVQSMKYLDNVISETLRMCPPAIRLERKANEDYFIEEANLKVPKDMIISIPVYSLHRDSKYYPDPEKFDPDRFNAESKALREQYTFLPFGAGPRNCIAMRFALMEIKVCLAYVLRTFRFKKSPLTKIPLDFYKGQGLLQPKEVMLQLELRQNSP
ncbi:uncharacterized protein LOC129233267 [Uloborus diversus]|uniref:uncharacterized protein LOC129233267 n=1 Tax=Uloborus diversus TaxID=327109 RepID=UPI00240A3478|nr:uncharacterized protein LOC129233267 [Uloborus diversus]